MTNYRALSMIEQIELQQENERLRKELDKAKIPDGMVLMPIVLTDAIAEELWKEGGEFYARELWANAIKAARGEV